MTMNLDDVRTILSPDEASESRLERLDASAVPHLVALADGDDVALAVKATYALGKVPSDEGGQALLRLASSLDPRIRMGAASSSRSYGPAVHEPVLTALLADPDPGVAKSALRAVPRRISPTLRGRIQERVNATGEPALRKLAAETLRRVDR
jgi:HEAT repeat protein